MYLLNNPYALDNCGPSLKNTPYSLEKTVTLNKRKNRQTIVIEINTVTK